MKNDVGKKNDAGKIRYGLVPPSTMMWLATALTHGAEKYGAFNWKNVESARYVDALYRHLEAARAGDIIDKDSGLPHLALAMTNLAFLLDRQTETGFNEVAFGGPVNILKAEDYYNELRKKGYI
jgi:hypothetical protein